MGDDPAKDGAPADPFTEQAVSAVALHQLFTAYVEAGFSEAQSIYLVGVMMATAIRREPGGGA